MSEPDCGEELRGGWQTAVRRVGDHVVRPARPWSATVVALLRHLADVGFSASPRPVGSGFDADGNELLTFVPGESPQPRPWSDEAASRIGELLAELHAATASFVPPRDASWQDWHGRHSCGAAPGIGHGDLGPWNIMAVGGMPAGLIDWDTAGPIDPVWELAQVAWLNAQLHDDDVAERAGLGTAEQRARQLALILDGYGFEHAARAGFVGRMVEVAVQSARDEAAQHAVTPESPALAANGFPVMWAITWRVRAASWMLSNRALLERAIGV